MSNAPAAEPLSTPRCRDCDRDETTTTLVPLVEADTKTPVQLCPECLQRVGPMRFGEAKIDAKRGVFSFSVFFGGSPR